MTTIKVKKAGRVTKSSPSKKKDLVARRNEYAAKFFPYIEKVARRLRAGCPPTWDRRPDLVGRHRPHGGRRALRPEPRRQVRGLRGVPHPRRDADDLRSRDTLSRDMRRLSNELRDATRRLGPSSAARPITRRSPKRLGVGVEELYARQQKLSGSSVVGIDDAGPDLLERTGDQSAADPFEAASRRELLGRLVGGIGDLPEKMQQVLSLYYCDNLNLKEIGTVLGVTESRVCQIHGEATRRLRTRWASWPWKQPLRSGAAAAVELSNIITILFRRANFSLKVGGPPAPIGVGMSNTTRHISRGGTGPGGSAPPLRSAAVGPEHEQGDTLRRLVAVASITSAPGYLAMKIFKASASSSFSLPAPRARRGCGRWPSRDTSPSREPEEGALASRGVPPGASGRDRRETPSEA